MLALNVNNPEIEYIFKENFHGNQESFFQFIIDAFHNQADMALIKKRRQEIHDILIGIENKEENLLSHHDVWETVDKHMQQYS